MQLTGADRAAHRTWNYSVVYQQSVTRCSGSMTTAAESHQSDAREMTCICSRSSAYHNMMSHDPTNTTADN